MFRKLDAALKAAVVSALIVLFSASTAFGRPWFWRSEGDYYGFGADGTIGRGTSILPGGPSDWDVRHPFGTVSQWTAPARPYQTTRTYEPGNGYRYPLYYNPATGTYFYYPAARR